MPNPLPTKKPLNTLEVMTFEERDPNENPWVAGKPKITSISIEPYSPDWKKVFQNQKAKIKDALGNTALTIEHIGSTAVPELHAKPIIDIDLIVKNPNQEESYIPMLKKIGYELIIREPSWYQHRMLRLKNPCVNLHIFAPNCAEHIRHCLFRDWLCEHEDDRQLYTNAKLAARHSVTTTQDYNQNKQSTVRAIYQKIFASLGWT